MENARPFFSCPPSLIFFLLLHFPVFFSPLFLLSSTLSTFVFSLFTPFFSSCVLTAAESVIERCHGCPHTHTQTHKRPSKRMNSVFCLCPSVACQMWVCLCRQWELCPFVVLGSYFEVTVTLKLHWKASAPAVQSLKKLATQKTDSTTLWYTTLFFFYMSCKVFILGSCCEVCGAIKQPCKIFGF